MKNMNATELLKEDHKKVETLFSQVESSADFSEKRRCFAQIRSELEVHTHIEETVLYPYFSNKEEFKDMIEEAYDEHQEAKTLLEEISSVKQDEEFEDKMSELIEAVRHHVKEEEHELFPKIEKFLNSEDLMVLGEKLIEAKQNYSVETKAA